MKALKGCLGSKKETFKRNIGYLQQDFMVKKNS